MTTENTAPEQTNQPTGEEVKTTVVAQPEGLEIVSTVAVKATDDPALNIALDYFAKQGIGASHQALSLAESGDFSVLRAELAAKKAPAWEQYVAIAEQAHQREQAAATASREKAVALAVQICGGQEEWAAVKNTVASNASQEELAEINAALRQGGLVAKSVVKYMKAVHEAAVGGGEAITPRGVGNNRSNGGSAVGGGALSPREYSAAVQELAKKIGRNAVDSSPEYAALQRRRAAFRG